MTYPPIALITDFGLQDPYVGILKGVIEQIAPSQIVIDVSHQIPPGDIRRAALVLWQSRPYFPENTIFVVVVDPGVGTARAPILVKSEDTYYIGPDNGVFSFVAQPGGQIWEITRPEYRLKIRSGNTFHGRDIFAPAAAYLSRGVPCSDFGDVRENIVRIADPLCEQGLDHGRLRQIRGEVLFADHFGNMITSIGRFEQSPNPEQWIYTPWLGKGSKHEIVLRDSHVKIKTRREEFDVPIYRNFQEIAPGNLGGLIGSTGLLEIVANQQSAVGIVHDSSCTVEFVIS